MDQTEHLASSRLFQGLDATQLQELLQISEMEAFEAEQVIFREGDRGDALYLVTQGEVRIVLPTGSGEEALTILRVGQSFGEMAAVDDAAGVRSATAVAHSDTMLLSIEQEQLQALLARRHDISHVVLSNVVRDLSAQLRETNNKLVFLSAAGRFE